MLEKFTKEEALAQIGESTRQWTGSVDYDHQALMHHEDFAEKMLVDVLDPFSEEREQQRADLQAADEALGLEETLKQEDCAKLPEDVMKHVRAMLNNAVRYGSLYGHGGEVEIEVNVCRNGVLIALEDQALMDFEHEEILADPDSVHDRYARDSGLRLVHSSPDVKASFEKTSAGLRTMLLYPFAEAA